MILVVYLARIALVADVAVEELNCIGDGDIALLFSISLCRRVAEEGNEGLLEAF